MYVAVILVATSLFGVSETRVESENRYRGQTMLYQYAPGDPDYDRSGLERETVYEDARGFPVLIELAYTSGVTASAHTYEDGHIRTIDYRFPDHSETEYYDLRQHLTRTDVFQADSLRETKYWDDSLRLTSSVTFEKDGRKITRYFDEKQTCRLTETVYPDGRKETRQTDEANQEKLNSQTPEGKGRVEIRPIPKQ
jgi:hypothetical protein